MRKVLILLAICAVAASFTGCKKESTATDQAKKKAAQQDNYVQQQAKKYTRSITGGQQAIKDQRQETGK